MKKLSIFSSGIPKAESFRQFIGNARRAIAYTWKIDKLNVVSTFVGIAVQIAASLAGAYFGAQVVGSLFNYLGTHSGDAGIVFINLGLSASFLAIEQLAWRYLKFSQQGALLKWNTAITPEFNHKIANLNIQRFEDAEFNRLLNKVRGDGQYGHSWMPGAFTFLCFNLIHGVLGMLSTAFILLSFAPWLVPVLLLAAVPSLLVEHSFAKVKWHISHIKGDSVRRHLKVTQMMHNKIDVSDMRLFGLTEYMANYCKRMLNDFNGEQQKTLSRFLKPAMLLRVAEGVVVVAIQVWLLFRVLAKNGFDVAQYTFYSGLVFQFNNSIGVTLATLTNALEHNLYMNDFYKFMDTPDLQEVPKNPVKLKNDHIPEICFENVSFRYPSAKKNVFTNLTVTIKPGEQVALVGENGVGKSTLIKLLMRFYDVTGGSIKIDGHDIRTLDLKSWYKMLGVLFQDFSRYPFSVKDNIRFGDIDKNATKEDIVKAASMAGLDKVVAELPKRYDTVLDNSFDEGVEPSGGQWQRVALARAFYRKAPVLILDEPTAAIDAKAEYEIFNHIFRERSSRSAIIVSHRFSTVRKADRILVLEKGRLIESGTHEELLAKNGLYHEMFTKQAEGYK